MVKQPIIPRDMVYGETKKSGGIIFMDTSNNNNFVHLIVQIASHEIQSFDKIFFGDQELTISSTGNDANGIARYKVTAPTQFSKISNQLGIGNQQVRIKLHTGTDAQLADADLVSESSKWTTDHKLSGIAYIYVRLEYDADTFPNGLPNISAQIKGKKLFDFRF